MTTCTDYINFRLNKYADFKRKKFKIENIKTKVKLLEDKRADQFESLASHNQLEDYDASYRSEMIYIQNPIHLVLDKTNLHSKEALEEIRKYNFEHQMELHSVNDLDHERIAFIKKNNALRSKIKALQRRRAEMNKSTLDFDTLARELKKEEEELANMANARATRRTGLTINNEMLPEDPLALAGGIGDARRGSASLRETPKSKRPSVKQFGEDEGGYTPAIPASQLPPKEVTDLVKEQIPTFVQSADYDKEDMTSPNKFFDEGGQNKPKKQYAHIIDEHSHGGEGQQDPNVTEASGTVRVKRERNKPGNDEARDTKKPEDENK